MAEIKSESVADFIPKSPADFPRNMQQPRRKGGIGVSRGAGAMAVLPLLGATPLAAFFEKFVALV
jgi:hypothetical protein